MRIRPLHDRLIVKRTDPEETTRGGIIIPDTVKEKPLEATVTAVGKGHTLKSGEVVPLQVKVGDRVLFAQYSGSDVKLDGEEYIILQERNVLLILE